ncbi:Rib/alpha-like domain-containing protein, partial [Facklamia hominis]
MPELTRVNNSNKIIFKESIKDIIDKEVPNVENGDLIYRFFIADENMVIQNQTVADGYFITGKEQAKEHPDATATNNTNWFSNSHSVLTYQPDAGTNGGFSFDHILVKNSKGTLNNYRDIQNREFAYKFQIDPRLLPYIDSVEAHIIEGNLTQGFNFNAYNPEREHSKYFADSPSGLGGRQREGWVDYEMRFNNGNEVQSQYTAKPDGTPQTGLSGTKSEVAWFDTNAGANDKAAYRYKVLKDGEGYFTLDNAPINFNSEQVWFSPGTTQDAVVRLVLKFKEGVDLNQVLTANEGKDTNYGVSGYFVNSKDELIPNSNTTGHIRVTDIDNDGIADDVDDNIKLPPKEETDSDKYTPEGQDVTTEVNTVPDAKDGIKSVTDKDGIDASDKVASYDWEKTPDVSKEGTFDNAVVVTYQDGTSERVPVKITVTDDRKDNEKYTPEVKPVEKTVGEEITEKDITDAVTVPDYVEKEEHPGQPKVTIDPDQTIPDGKTVGDFEVTVTVEYPDGTKDEGVKVPVKVTEEDTTAPRIDRIGDQTVVEGNPIKDVTVTTNDPEAEISVDKLPEGVTFDKDTNTISGTPTVANWGEDEVKEYDVQVTAKDKAGNEETTEFKITVQRDTDGDGIPDIYDKDDDGDGVSDEDEKDKGTDPKDKDSKPEDSGDEDKTTVDNSNVKPVDPTDESQDTGIVVKNPDEDTKVSGKDEDGKNIPTEIDKDGKVIVTPGEDVDGPITVVIEDPDLPGGKVEVEVPVNGHEKDRDDNGSDKDGKTTVDDSNVKPVDPTDEDQGTGVIVTNPDEDTKVTAKDEDGKDVPATINPETGEIVVTPGEDVDGPITVVVEDPDLPGGKVEVEVPVNGHEKDRDD